MLDFQEGSYLHMSDLSVLATNAKYRHQKSKTGVSVTPQKDLCPPKFKTKQNKTKHKNDSPKFLFC